MAPAIEYDEEGIDAGKGVANRIGRTFELVLDHGVALSDRPVAALVYGRQKHLINLFIWPDAGHLTTGAEETTSQQGYNLVHWTQAGMTLWAVSDLNSRELSEFAHLIRSSP